MTTDPQKILDFFHHREIRREMALYGRTHRPIHAWRAYYWIRQAGLPVPPWFLELLDECADRIMKSPLKKPEQIAEAFDMKATGRHRTESHRLQAVETVLALKEDRKPGETDRAIYDKVAKDFGVNWTYVRNAYQDWITKKMGRFIVMDDHGFM
jgi:hypothetical protein